MEGCSQQGAATNADFSTVIASRAANDAHGALTKNFYTADHDRGAAMDGTVRFSFTAFFAAFLTLAGLVCAVPSASARTAGAARMNQAATGSSEPLLLIHGYTDNCIAAFSPENITSNTQSPPAGPKGLEGADQALASAGFTDIVAVGYYTNETNQGSNSESSSGCQAAVTDAPEVGSTASGADSSSDKCLSIPHTHANGSATVDDTGTKDDPIRHIACRLAWYIYDTYTNAFAGLGIYRATSGGYLAVTLTDQSLKNGDAYVAADTMSFVQVTCPSVVEGTTYPALTEGPGSPLSQFSLGSDWSNRFGHGDLGYEKWTNTHGSTPVSTATWTFTGLPVGTTYYACAYIPDNYANNTAAHYQGFQGNNTAPAFMTSLNQANLTGWVPLGVLQTDTTGKLTVTLDDTGPTGTYTAADAIRLQTTYPC